MAKRGSSGNSGNQALESCKTSAEILREARAAIRLADSMDQPYSSLDINSTGSDYSEKNSIPDKTTNKKSQSVNVYPSSGHSFPQLANLQPTVVPAALFQRQQPSKPKSYNKSGSGNASTSPQFGNYGYAPSPTEAYRLPSASSENRPNTTATSSNVKESDSKDMTTNYGGRQSLDKENTRLELMAILGTIRQENEGTENDKNMETLRVLILDNKEVLKHGPLRSEVMKEMFRLLNESGPDFTVKIVKIILELKPSGKNLTTIFKVTYRLSENANNDQFLMEKDFITRFITILQELPTSKYPHALLYGYGMLKNLSLNETFVKLLGEIGNLTPTLLKHLSGLTRQMQRKIGKHEAAYTSFIYLLDVSKALTIDPEVSVKIYTNEVNLVSELCGTMAVCVHDLDITLKIVEILRCVARYEESCESFARCAFCFPVCVQIVKKYFGHQFLVKGICYVLGSLVATRKKASLQLYQTPQALDVLLALLHHYVSNERNSAHQYKKYGKSNSFEESENNSVIYKVLRVLANMSCLDEVGQSLAKHTLCVDLLLDILNPKIVSLEKQVFLATLTTLSNMAYYLGTSLGPTAVLLAEKLLPFLGSEDPEILVETYHNFSNLSHNEEVRALLIKRKTIPMLLNNLEEDYLALVYYASGILLNLLVEREGRLQFHENGGISRTVAAIQDLLPDEWTIGSMLCQLIWNFAHSQIGQSVNITSQESHLLIQSLEELIDQNFVYPDEEQGNEDEKEERIKWKTEFVPLAIELLDFLTGGVAEI